MLLNEVKAGCRVFDCERYEKQPDPITVLTDLVPSSGTSIRSRS
jgi:hypothetical protein